VAIQAIIYSKATGRVRRVLDPQANVPNVIAFLAQAGAQTGEGVIVYTKQGGGADTLNAWQAAVNTVTGLSPSTGDWYCGVDGSNNILWWGIADPALDSVAGLTLINAPYGADNRWTYLAGVFTAPLPGVKP
jgi:hypothetical protein